MMSDKIKELLAVLDMSAQEQVEWVFDNVETGECDIDIDVLADLAFRLRDEVGKIDAVYWEKAVYMVYTRAHIRPYDNVFCWMTEWGRPIDWIIAALIAKELGKDAGKAGE